MRKYNETTKCLDRVVCNKCGREMKVENGIVREEVQKIEIKWGYFSRDDGNVISFDMCEDCINDLIKGFAVKVDKKENVELV